MHFYRGLPISLYYFAEGGNAINGPNSISNSTDSMKGTKGSLKLRKVTLGPEGPGKGQTFHATITKNTWFARILEKDEIASTNTKIPKGVYIVIVHWVLYLFP